MPLTVSYNITNSETQNTSTTFTVTGRKWNKQCLLSGVSGLSIVTCWTDATQALHRCCRDSLKVEQRLLIYIAIN